MCAVFKWSLSHSRLSWQSGSLLEFQWDSVDKGFFVENDGHPVADRSLCCIFRWLTSE